MIEPTLPASQRSEFFMAMAQQNLALDLGTTL